MSIASSATSRREFLQQLAGTNDNAVSPTPREPAPAPSLAAHVANRLMYGPKPGDVAAIEAQGVDNWISTQLNPTSSDTAALTAALAELPTATLSENITQLYDRRYMEYADAIRPARELRHATIARMMHSQWQLRELMVEFWHNHFNVYGWDSPIMSLMPDWDRCIREHCFGNFRAFLEATGRHPVMLHYLDNYLSTNAGPNENYARELFELHSLGAMNYNTEDGYIDEDVYEASRCFTGWSYERTRTASDRGQFKYYRENHDRFQKVVLGTPIPRDQADLLDGQQVLDLICNHPGTARFIVTKLCRRFVADEPPVSLIDSAVTVFYQHRTSPDQIKRTLQHIFASAEFRNPAYRANKFKKPFDWMISTMRALTIPYIYREGENALDMTGMMNALGQTMFGWRSPDGPPDTFFNWATANSMMRRYNFVFRIDSGWWTDRGLTFPSVSIMPENLRTTRQVCDWWIQRVIQRPVSSSSYEALLTFVAEGRNFDLPMPPAQVTDKVSRVAILCTLTPEFMWR